jgi:hypothetical protein
VHRERFLTLKKGLSWLRNDKKTTDEAAIGLKREMQEEMEVEGKQHHERRFGMAAMSFGNPTLTPQDMLK